MGGSLISKLAVKKVPKRMTTQLRVAVKNRIGGADIAVPSYMESPSPAKLTTDESKKGGPKSYATFAERDSEDYLFCSEDGEEVPVRVKRRNPMGYQPFVRKPFTRERKLSIEEGCDLGSAIIGKKTIK